VPTFTFDSFRPFQAEVLAHPKEEQGRLGSDYSSTTIVTQKARGTQDAPSIPLVNTPYRGGSDRSSGTPRTSVAPTLRGKRKRALPAVAYI